MTSRFSSPTVFLMSLKPEAPRTSVILSSRLDEVDEARLQGLGLVVDPEEARPGGTGSGQGGRPRAARASRS